ncbi:MAG TPA: SPFH domain-containing protein [Rhizomicrobium sp.]|jgi:regulator of protease activity HflC (stomatin/prohibitin superfamily)|nr:SPFH domain-containing protein [Rhizomicrobium sp.]
MSSAAQQQPTHKSVETRGGGTSGGFAAIVWVLLLLGSFALFMEFPPFGIALFIVALFWGGGFYTLQPNMASVLTLFGRYLSTDRSQGLRWVPFWIGRKKVSLRARNVTSEKLKVNDNRGNPIEIAANVVWHVEDTAQATFDVDNYLDFVNIQIETGLRAIASSYAYDHGEESEPTLRASGDHVAGVLRTELQERVAVAGITIDDARISHLAYAPEIAGAMLRRQQAQAILEARKLIVEGAVGMVEHALSQLGERRVVELDEERKAQMVSNLLVVLCSDHDAQPVLNTGTLYS